MSKLLSHISSVLVNRFPSVSFELFDDMLIIPAENEFGYDIKVVTGERENLLFLNNYHEHFECSDIEDEALLESFWWALTKKARLKVYSKSNREFKWVFQFFDDMDRKWQTLGAASKLTYQFWKKSEVNIYQNNIIDPEHLIETKANST